MTTTARTATAVGTTGSRRLGRGTAFAVLTFLLAALTLLGGVGSAAASTPATGGGGLNYPYLPTAVAYASDSSTGCKLGYFYGDNGQSFAPATPITCLPYASDFDPNATAYATYPNAACAAGFQTVRGLGDGTSTPYYTFCVPFAEGGAAGVNDNGYITTVAAGCAPGYYISSRDDYPGDQAAICLLSSHPDYATPTPCVETLYGVGAQRHLLPCVLGPDNKGHIVYPAPKPAPKPVPVLGNHHAAYIAGVGKVGVHLAARAGAFTTSRVTVHYQWYSNGKGIRGATKSVFVVTSGYRKHSLTVRIIGSKAGYKSWVNLSHAVAIH